MNEAPSRRRVLLLEDEPMVRTTWLRIALSVPVELLAVETVDQARLLLGEGRFDLVVCDFHLGGQKTSEDLLRELAAQGIASVVMSADGRVLERLRASHAVLAKPSHIDEIEALLAGGTRPAGPRVPPARRRQA